MVLMIELKIVTYQSNNLSYKLFENEYKANRSFLENNNLFIMKILYRNAILEWD